MKKIGMRLSLFLIVAFLLVGCATAKSEYKKARQEYTIEAWESFIQKHPDTKQAECAKIHLAHLQSKTGGQSIEPEVEPDVPGKECEEEIAKKAEVEKKGEPTENQITGLKELKPEQAWQKAQQSDTVKAYKNYLAAFPESPNAKAAQKRLGALMLSRDWASAKASNSMSAYQKFIRKYPSSNYEKEAQQRMASLDAEDEWKKTLAQNSEAGWVNYIVAYTDSARAKDAIKRLRKHKVVGPGGIIDWIRVGGKIWSQPRDDGFSNYTGSSSKNVVIKREEELTYYCRNSTELKFPNWVKLNKIKVTGHLKAGPAGFRLLEGLALVPTNK
jgi:hypothetical protein